MDGELSRLGRGLVVAGMMLAAVGVIVLLAGKVPLLGRLPGDIVYRKGGTTLYFPLVTCLLLSLILSLLLNLIRRETLAPGELPRPVSVRVGAGWSG